MAELPTGWGQPNSNTANPLLSVSCLLYLSLKGGCFQSFHLSQLLHLAGSGNKSFHNNLKWKCWRGEGLLPDRRHVLSWLPGQSSLSRPQLTSGVQRSYITTTVQLNSIKFSLGECGRHNFKTKYVLLEELPSSKQTVGVLSTRQASVAWPPSSKTPAGCPGLQLLVTSAPLRTISKSCHSASSVQMWGKAPCPRHSCLRMGSPPQLAPHWGSPVLPAPWHQCAASEKHYCLGEQAVKITQYTQQLHRGKSASCNFNCKLFHGPSFQRGP